MKKFFLRVADRDQGLDSAAHNLSSGADRHDVLENAIRILELDPSDDSVGYGGCPNILGEMEFDGAFMNGNDRNLGAIASIKNFLPVRVARRLMEKKLHTLLVGDGAERFANECGFTPDKTLSDYQRDLWVKNIRPIIDNHKHVPLYDIVKLVANPHNKNFDTTVMVASDGQGISAAASTSGWSYKYPGRVGDTPLAGSGLYVDSRYGAAACTFTGEMSTRTGAARLIVESLCLGLNVKEAVDRTIRDISHLQGGVLRTLVLHAIDRDGQDYTVAINAEKPVYYYYWNDDLAKPIRKEAQAIQIPNLVWDGKTPFSY